MDRNRGFDINALRQQLEDLFEDFFPGGQRRPGAAGQRAEQGQHLPVNLVETDDAFVLTAPLPGFQPEDIDITVRGQNLTLRAQRRNPPTERPNFLRREWGYGPYQRSLELPGPVDADSAHAAFRQGTVTVTVPKAERARTINIDETETVEVEGEGEEFGEPETAPAAEPVNEPGAAAVLETEAAEEGAPAPVGEAASEAETPEAEGRGGRPFYMPRGQERGRRGDRSGRNTGPRGGQRPPSITTEETPSGSPEETVTPGPEPSVAESVERDMTGIDGALTENTTASMEASPETVADIAESMQTTATETAPGEGEPEAAAQAAIGSEPERPQEPGFDDASPVQHTTTASETARDSGDQVGTPTVPAGSEPAAEAGGEVTDTAEAGESQASSKPTD